MKKQKFVKTLADLGSSWELSDETEVVEDFICERYGKKCQNINLLRYDLYCAKGGKVEPEALPPCRSSLKLHVLRANCQSAVWRRSLFLQPNVPSPCGHGWEICEDTITIQWLGSKPAPEEILELLCCTCKISCAIEFCCCLKAGLKCTDLCAIECEHIVNENLSNVMMLTMMRLLMNYFKYQKLWCCSMRNDIVLALSC